MIVFSVIRKEKMEVEAEKINNNKKKITTPKLKDTQEAMAWNLSNHETYNNIHLYKKIKFSKDFHVFYGNFNPFHINQTIIGDD